MHTIGNHHPAPTHDHAQAAKKPKPYPSALITSKMELYITLTSILRAELFEELVELFIDHLLDLLGDLLGLRHH
jgi:hypothetical protein